MKRDVCELCKAVRVEEDDDGHAGAISPNARPRPIGSGVCWVTVRGFRVCGACVFDALREKLPSTIVV